MAISKLTYEMRMDVIETPAISVSTYPDPAVTHLIQAGQSLSGAGAFLFLDTSTTPPIDTVGGAQFTLAGGTLSVDLTAFDQGNLPNVNFTGKIIRMIKLAANGANTDRVRIRVGASDGFELFGGSSGEIFLDKGEVCQCYFPEGLTVVGAADKIIDLSSPDVNAKITMLLAAGL